MTSNIYLEYLLQNEKSFLGCFHKNNLPSLPTPPASLIIYADQHWVGIKFVNTRLCFYFDSFGENIRDTKIINFLLREYKWVIRNKLKIQDNSSYKCGLFCALFVKLVHNLKDFQNYLYLFQCDDLIRNDYIVESVLRIKK